ncbi:MAG: NAD(P)(+) transhydrogenase (Re/Si-specific) subunit beta [Bacilli bacterium]
MIELLKNDIVYYIVSGVLALLVMFGIFLMSKVEKARLGNGLSALSMLLAVIITLLRHEIIGIWYLYLFLGIGAIIGIFISVKVKMIETPQMIALLNGLGGLASTIVGGFALFKIGADGSLFSQITALIALLVGSTTFVGSLIAALKLARKMTQKPITLPYHSLLLSILLVLMLALIVITAFLPLNPLIVVIMGVVVSSLFGLVFTIKIGGADMPITISLLNSLSGVAGAITGLAINDILLVSIGGIVGASGLLLTQIMCKAMNRKLFDILLGKTSTKTVEQQQTVEKVDGNQIKSDPYKVIKNAKNVIIVPGYGMAIAQAQYQVKELADFLKEQGANVKFAIHPVAGRMPGHMNVLLAEVDVDYDDLYEMETINPEFKDADVTIVVGANDVLNPAARNQPNTPLYGMPILNVDQSKEVIIFNYDLKPGYSGVNNPLYTKTIVHLFLGNAKDTLQEFLNNLKK